MFRVWVRESNVLQKALLVHSAVLLIALVATVVVVKLDVDWIASHPTGAAPEDALGQSSPFTAAGYVLAALLPPGAVALVALTAITLASKREGAPTRARLTVS